MSPMKQYDFDLYKCCGTKMKDANVGADIPELLVESRFCCINGPLMKMAAGGMVLILLLYLHQHLY